jgi:hypothetical protein
MPSRFNEIVIIKSVFFFMSANVSKVFGHFFEEIKKKVSAYSNENTYFCTSNHPFRNPLLRACYSIQEAAMTLKIVPKAACDPENYSESR